MIFSLLAIGIIIGLIIVITKSVIDGQKRTKIVNKNKADFNSRYTLECLHVKGLPVAPGAQTDLYYNDDEILIIREDTKIHISLSKVNSMDLAHGDAISQYGVNLRSSAYCLVITYNSENEEKMILLEVYSVYSNKANEIVKYFNDTNKTNKNIVL